MENRQAYSLFEVFGVELEYMIVDRETLAVRPIADSFFFDVAGAYANEVVRGEVAWSNELVNHVVELKTAAPTPTLEGWSERFAASVAEINERLAAHGAMLLPTGAHPLMDPFTETRLWPHAYSEIYRLYNRIFDCRGHGWSNLQSAHLNLPFRGDDEFGRLHAAVRVLLPVIPALSASTPILDGKVTGFADARLEAYRHNQASIPEIAGQVVPEPVFTEADYYRRVFDPIDAAVRPYDEDNVLEHFFVNSRGAIARFDRGAIEIRVIDLQECPAADLAILEGIVAVLRALVAGRWAPLSELMAWSETDLAAILRRVIRDGEAAVIDDPAYLRLFGLDAQAVTARDLWRHLQGEIPADPRLAHIVEHGSLSTRILRRLGPDPDAGRIRTVYHELARCLATNEML